MIRFIYFFNPLKAYVKHNPSFFLIIIFYLIVGQSINICAQQTNTNADSTFNIKTDSNGVLIKKYLIGGGSITVPSSKTWQVKNIYVNNGGSYNILVTSIKYNKPLAEGSKIYSPTWCAEAELIGSDITSLTYIYIIEER